MNQLSIDFSAVRLARRSDPVTSHQAAANVQKFARGHAALILEALKEYGPMTSDELTRKVDLNNVQICRRLPELQRNCHAAPTGITRLSASGCPEREWMAL